MSGNENSTMFNIQDFFTKDDKTYQSEGIVLFNFDDSRSVEFLDFFVKFFRRAY